MKQAETALIIVDAQRGFMPATEGERLGLPGFGEIGALEAIEGKGAGGKALVGEHFFQVFSRKRIVGPVAKILGQYTALVEHPEQSSHLIY